MVDFVGRSNTGIYDEMEDANSYWGNVHTRRQQRWQDNEARRAYDRAQRDARSANVENIRYGDELAGLVDDRTAMLGSIRQRNVPNAVPTNPGAAPGTPGGGPVSLQPGGTTPPVAAATSTGRSRSTNELVQNRIGNVGPRLTQAQIDAGLTPEQVATLQSTANPVPIMARDLTYPQLRAYNAYIAATRQNPQRPDSSRRQDISSVELARVMNGLHSNGLDIINDRLVRTSAPQESMSFNDLPDEFNISEYSGERGTTDITADLQSGETGLNASGNGTTTANVNEYFQGIGDTSSPLQATPEMELMQSTSEHMLRRARLHAQSGNTAASDQAFAAALQGHLTVIQQSRGILFSAAAGGSRDATAALIADTGGLRRENVRVQATPEATPRFIVQINTAEDNQPENWVSNYQQPLSQDSLVNTLQNLYDQAGAAGRAELAMEQAQIVNTRDIALAEIEGRRQVAIINSLTDIEKAQLDSDTRMAIAQGTGRMIQDTETGTIWYARPGNRARGEPATVFTVLRIEDLQTANVDGDDETVPTPTASQVN